MNEEINVVSTEQQDVADSQETGKDTQMEVKTFSQDEVNEIVEKRLIRERRKYASIPGLDPKEVEIAEREQTLVERELKFNARETFKENGLPMEFLELLDYTNKDSCDKAIELVQAAFAANVQTEVEKRLRGGAPLKRAPSGEPSADIRGAFGLV